MMKQILCALLAGLLLCGCGAAPAALRGSPAAPTEAPPRAVGQEDPSPTPAAAPAGTAAPAETPAPDGALFLTVSSLTFSLVGESEDVYCGTLPAEAVTWTSDDETVVSAEGGVLTAVGVGETTVRAVCGAQRAQCAVGCLAADEAALAALPEEVRRAPKRLPFLTDFDPVPYFADAVFVGDSISWVLFQHEMHNGLLGHPTSLAAGGTGINGYLNRTKTVHFRGAEMALEDAVAACGKRKVFIMLGQNDLGWRSVEDTLASYGELIAAIRGKAPEAEIHIQSCIPEWCATGAPNERNEKIFALDALLPDFCAENGLHYMELGRYVEDHTGRMATCYTMDHGIHMNENGSLVWIQVLTAYAALEAAGTEETT